MGTNYWACDDAGKRWADIGKAYDLFDAVDAAGLDAHRPVLTVDFLTAYLAAHPDDAYRIEPLLRWQREVCGGRPLSLWNEHADDRPWMDWDSPDWHQLYRPDWTKDDPTSSKWWATREPVTAKEGKE